LYFYIVNKSQNPSPCEQTNLEKQEKTKKFQLPIFHSLCFAERNLGTTASCGKCSFDVSAGTCITKLKKMSNCPGCGRKTVAASYRVGGSLNSGGGGGGGGGDSDGGGGDDDDGDGSDGWESFMAAHRRKEDDDEKFCDDVSDLRDAKEDGKVAILLNGKGWMSDIHDELDSEDPKLLAKVERIIVKNMGMDYDDKDMFAFILRHMPALKHLEFACHHWGPRGFDASFCSQGLAQLKNLESIEMYEVHLCDSAAVHVAKAFAALPKLKRVDINMADRYDDEWTSRSEAKAAERLTLKGYTAIFNAIRGRVEFLKLRLVLCDSGIGAAKQFEALASAGLKELSVSVDTFRASEEQEAQGREEFSAMLRHFCSCPSLGILTFDFSLVPPETILEVLAANPHLVKLEYDFFDQWTIDHYCKLLKIIYASKIISFKQSGYLSFKGQQWWRIARLVKQFGDKKGWKGYEGDLEVYNRLSSDDIDRVWGSSRYRTSDVSSDESPNSRESLFEEDNKPRAAAAAPARGAAAAPAPAAARSMPPGRGAAPPGAAAARVPPARAGVSTPARVGAPRGGMPTPPSRGATPTPPSRGATPTPPAAAAGRGAMPSRGAVPTPPARTSAAAASGLSGRAAIAAARAAPPAPALDVGVTGNWKLKDKKSIKNEMSVLEEAVASVKSKLGDEWSLVIDWPAIGEATSSRDDREPGENVIQRLVNKFISNDVDEFDSDVVDALNGLCGTKCVTFSCVSEHRDGERVKVSASASGIEIVWSADWWGYEYRDAYVRDWTLSNC
jgi:hypothetical protein